MGSVAITVDQVGRRAAAEAQAAGLSSAIAAVDRVLVAPEHWIVGLKDSSGAAGGSISWSSQDLVVLTTALAAATGRARYACWLLEDAAGVEDRDDVLRRPDRVLGGLAGRVGNVPHRDEHAIPVTLPQPGDTRFGGPIYLSARPRRFLSASATSPRIRTASRTGARDRGGTRRRRVGRRRDLGQRLLRHEAGLDDPAQLRLRERIVSGGS